METKIYNQEGKEEGKIKLPEDVFGLPWNSDLVHQVIVGMQENKRAGIAHTKDRSEVSGTGRKPWRQKGTGRARHGSRRSPIWRTGGVAFGPRKDRNYSQKINKKMKAKALYIILSQKMRDGEVLFIDNIDLKEAKTKNAQTVINSLGKVSGFETIPTSKKENVYLTFSGNNQNLKQGFRNLPQIYFEEIKNINPLDLMNYKYLIITSPKDSIKFISSKLSMKSK